MDNGEFNRSEVDRDVDSLKGDLNQLKSDLASLKDSLMGVGRNSARRVKGEAEERYEETMETIKSVIEERPVTSLLVAFGVGLIAGRIFAGK